MPTEQTRLLARVDTLQEALDKSRREADNLREKIVDATLRWTWHARLLDERLAEAETERDSAVASAAALEAERDELAEALDEERSIVGYNGEAWRAMRAERDSLADRMAKMQESMARRIRHADAAKIATPEQAMGMLERQDADRRALLKELRDQIVEHLNDYP